MRWHYSIMNTDTITQQVQNTFLYFYCRRNVLTTVCPDFLYQIVFDQQMQQQLSRMSRHSNSLCIRARGSGIEYVIGSYSQSTCITFHWLTRGISVVSTFYWFYCHGLVDLHGIKVPNMSSSTTGEKRVSPNTKTKRGKPPRCRSTAAVVWQQLTKTILCPERLRHFLPLLLDVGAFQNTKVSR